jgi:hypothetical protein
MELNLNRVPSSGFPVLSFQLSNKNFAQIFGFARNCNSRTIDQVLLVSFFNLKFPFQGFQFEAATDFLLHRKISDSPSLVHIDTVPGFKSLNHEYRKLETLNWEL